jgi:CRISPR-associated protein Csx16
LVEGLKAYGESIRNQIPPLSEVLDPLAERVAPLAEASDHLATPAGLRALHALARWYFELGRYAEAAVVLREGWVTLYADAAAAFPGDEARFDRRYRELAEQRWGQQAPEARAIAEIRNDIEHGGFNKRPLPPRTLREGLERLIAAFKAAIDEPPSEAGRATGSASRTHFVSRHPGARE